MSKMMPVHPGEVLRDNLAELEIGVSEAALKLGISRSALSRVVNCHGAISPNLARRLEQAGLGTARMWLAVQLSHELAVEQSGEAPNVQKLVA
ncbi:MAG: HigA family addiction module antidote protein [Propionibacteriaceae bacterium]|nr:HigA family addiction module antidote protein [Propionibacteriaceae bacterium]